MEQLELDQHFAIVADLVGAGGEMSVPEQRHLLLQGTIGGRPCGPPTIAATRRVSSAVARNQKKNWLTTGCIRRDPPGFTRTPMASPVVSALRVVAGRLGGNTFSVGS